MSNGENGECGNLSFVPETDSMAGSMMDVTMTSTDDASSDVCLTQSSVFGEDCQHNSGLTGIWKGSQKVRLNLLVSTFII